MRDAPDAPAAPAAVGTSGLPVIAGGSQEADALAEAAAAGPQPEVLLVAWIAAAATVVLGIVPQPLFQLAAHAGRALTGIF
jgi:hypothetical protein